MTRALRFAVLFTTTFAASACSLSAGGFCAAAAECDSLEAIALDRVGESNDSIDVCVADMDGLVRTLRANEEEVCQRHADAVEAYMACVADVFAKDEGDACDGFVISNANPCDDQLEEISDAIRDADDQCSPSER